LKFLNFNFEFFFGFFKQNKMLSQTCREKPNIQHESPAIALKNLISPQAHGGIIAFQGRSRRDYVNC